ncbi:MAG: type II secretion system F family protein [Acidisphaera sp.]|nr:type II secretion system F family protein [Acidisphaera sp.]
MRQLTELLLLSFIGLAGLGFGCWLVLRLQTRQDHFRKRMNAICAAYARPRVNEAPPLLRLAMAMPKDDLARMAARVFGFDWSQPDLYPVKWWLVLGVAAGLVRAGLGLAVGLIGDYAYILAPIAWVFLCRSFFGWCERRRTGILYRQFPDALAMIVRAVRVGIPVAEAIRMVARESIEPTATEFGKLSDQLSIGRALDEALRDMGARNNLAEYRFFATALSLQNQTGGGLAETLENLADVIRKRVALKARGRALASEARTSAGILAALPILTGLALWVLNPTYIAVLFTTTKGEHILAAAIGALGGGLFVMRMMINRSLA